MKKNSFAVYSPQDPFERAIQDAYHEHNIGWLDMASCQLLKRALLSLKMFEDDWFNSFDLMRQRIRYFFSPHMSLNKDVLIFPTTTLFLRDVLENNSVNCFLTNPVTFVSTPISHYLLKEYPINILVDKHKLTSSNSETPLDVGGLVIFDQHNVVLEKEAILDVKIRKSEEVSRNEVEKLTDEMGYQKVAISLRGPGVFCNDEDRRNIKPKAKVWDKFDRESGMIITVEPGERGSIEVLLDGGTKKVISQMDFDREFVLV